MMWMAREGYESCACAAACQNTAADANSALIYFISPLDLFPDVLPIVGFTDDAAVMAGAIKLVWDQIKPEHRDAAREALERINEASET